MKRFITPALFGIVALFAGCAPIALPPPGDNYLHLLLGNPSSAKTDPQDKDNFLMAKKYYALSYNDSRGTPNWVSWVVTKEDLGEAPRKPTFDTDSELPQGFRRITHKDYSGSGFDRGHLCPHSDRAADNEMSFSTFVMTNVVPQAPKLNQKTWNQLEIYLRNQVRHGHQLYVVAGPAGNGGRGTHGFKEEIGSGKVVVPAQCWKIAVVVPQGEMGDLSKINPRTRVIAVLMPNDEEKIDLHWAKYRTSVRDIEQLTGYTFFDRLAPDLANELKEKVDTVRISHASHSGGGDE